MRTSQLPAPPSARSPVMVFAPALVLVAFGLWATELRQRAIDDARLAAHAEDVFNVIALLEGHVRDAETGQRGFVITGVEEYLEPYRRGRDSTFLEISRLETLTAGNQTQERLIQELKPIVREKLDRMDSTVSQRRRGGADSAMAMVRTGVGRRLMESIQGLLRAVRTQERQLLNARVASGLAARRQMFVVLALGVALSIVFSLIVAIRLSNMAMHHWLMTVELEARIRALTAQVRAHEETPRAIDAAAARGAGFPS